MKFLHICFFLIGIMSCSKNRISDCDMAYVHFKDKYEKNYGAFYLNDSNDYWLNYSTNLSKKVSFRNKQNYVLMYLEKGSKAFGRFQDLRRYNKGDVEECVGYITNVDYYSCQYETLTYEPLNDGNKFMFTRYQDIKWESIPVDSFKLVGKAEYLQFRDTKNNSYETYYNSMFYPDTLMQTASQKYHQNILLRGKEYNKIFELINTKADSLKIQVKGYYYSYETGLLGYYLSNNELWLRD